MAIKSTEIECVDVYAYGLAAEYRFTMRVPKMPDSKQQILLAIKDAQTLNEGDLYPHLINNPIRYISLPGGKSYFAVNKTKCVGYSFREVIEISKKEMKYEV